MSKILTLPGRALSGAEAQGPNEKLIEYLRELLESAESGEMQSFAGIFAYRDNTLAHGWVIPTLGDCRSITGQGHALLWDLAQMIVNDSETSSYE